MLEPLLRFDLKRVVLLRLEGEADAFLLLEFLLLATDLVVEVENLIRAGLGVALQLRTGRLVRLASALRLETEVVVRGFEGRETHKQVADLVVLVRDVENLLQVLVAVLLQRQTKKESTILLANGLRRLRHLRRLHLLISHVFLDHCGRGLLLGLKLAQKFLQHDNVTFLHCP